MRVDEAKRVLERELDRFASIGWLASDWREQIADLEIEVKGAKMSVDGSVAERARVVSRSGDSVESIDGSVTRFCLQQNVTTLCTESGRKIEVPGHRGADQEYDVEITVTPRRWAPKEWKWEYGDVLVLGANTQRVFYRDKEKVLYSFIGGREVGVPLEAIRAFDRAGLLK